MYSKITIVGNVGRDPEMRYLPDGTAVCDFSVAVSKRVKGEKKTTWFRVTCWRKLAETVNEYVHKGKLVLVDGDIDYSVYDKGGETRVTLEVTASDVRFLSGGNDRNGGERDERSAPADDLGDIPF